MCPRKTFLNVFTQIKKITRTFCNPKNNKIINKDTELSKVLKLMQEFVLNL